MFSTSARTTSASVRASAADAIATRVGRSSARTRPTSSSTRERRASSSTAAAASAAATGIVLANRHSAATRERVARANARRGATRGNRRKGESSASTTRARHVEPSRVRAGPTTVDDEPFEEMGSDDARDGRGDADDATERERNENDARGDPRTPSASGGWNASTRVTPGDSARVSGGSARRAASAWDGAREGDSPWIERDGSTRASTSNGRDVGGASAVKPTKTPRERLQSRPSGRRRGRMSGERAEDDRDATMDCHRDGGRVSKEKAKSSEDLDVEEEVLRILRGAARDSASAEPASAPCEAREAIEIKATDTVKARESSGVLRRREVQRTRI